jgi:hypothetical protein
MHGYLLFERKCKGWQLSLMVFQNSQRSSATRQNADTVGSYDLMFSREREAHPAAAAPHGTDANTSGSQHQ